MVGTQRRANGAHMEVGTDLDRIFKATDGLRGIES